MNKQYLSISLALLLFIICALSSCQKETESTEYINIQALYRLSLGQELSPNGGRPIIKVSTIEEANCENSFISYQKFKQNERIHIRFNDVIQDGNCIEKATFLKESIPFEQITGTHNIEVSLKDIITNLGFINVNMLTMNFNLNTKYGFHVDKTRINRIQKNMMWGYFYSEKQETQILIEGYLRAIDKKISYATGDYDFFTLDDRQEVLINNVNNSYPFLISTDKKFELFKTFIESVKETDPTFEFNATNYDGNTIIVD